ncbi:hypothetical protein E2C01_031186 [Portunus trituberculatus]|uniref:Uncharacterized protein n=1 Tax=Portunus trituberculatus TaxID=210409 RepID=A0A5B7EXF2_PORTR|nr:hypothetical protein [Portunus trituberculatus]
MSTSQASTVLSSPNSQESLFSTHKNELNRTGSAEYRLKPRLSPPLPPHSHEDISHRSHRACLVNEAVKHSEGLSWRGICCMSHKLVSEVADGKDMCGMTRLPQNQHVHAGGGRGTGVAGHGVFAAAAQDSGLGTGILKHSIL